MEFQILHSIWSTSVDNVVNRTNKNNNNNSKKKKNSKINNISKSKEDLSVKRKSSVDSDSSSKSEKLSVKARMQIKIKNLWHNRTFISLLCTQLLQIGIVPHRDVDGSNPYPSKCNF